MTLDGKVLGYLGSTGRQLKEFGWIHEIACPSENTLIVGELLNWRAQKLVPEAQREMPDFVCGAGWQTGGGLSTSASCLDTSVETACTSACATLLQHVLLEHLAADHAAVNDALPNRLRQTPRRCVRRWSIPDLR